LEPFPERRDVYTHTKVLQELLFQRYRSGGCFQSVILRPGVIYGESRDPLFSRTGIRIGGLVFQPGARGTLPISYVENCASAVVWATTFKVPEGAYNVIDDEAPTARNFLRQYEEQVGGIFAVRLPKLLVYATSYCVEKYSRYSCGQIPPFLTPYKLNSTWTAHRFENARLKGTGWVQPVPTSEAIRRTFRHAAGIRSIQTAAERNSYASSWHI
jgi:nucleoside-diphosphate-sugar epimerase